MRPSPRWPPWFWHVAGGLFLAFSAALTVISREFVHGEGYEERPIPAVFLLLLAWGAIYFGVAVAALHRPPGVRTVIVWAVLLRAVILPSMPIQEDDIYRYLWDGKVVAAGLDPFLHSPREALEAGAPREIDERSLRPFARLRDRSPENRALLERVNHPELVSVYPTIVQWCFGVVGAVVPHGWGVPAQILVLKGFLVLFDLGTLFLLILLLERSGLAPGRAVLYAWCPLVLKEVANSGHMDPIPVFFLSASLLLAVLARDSEITGRRNVAAFSAGAFLGAAVSAKLFAAVLLPLVVRWTGERVSRVLLPAAVAAALLPLAFTTEGAGRRAETLAYFLLGWEQNAAFFLWLEKLVRAVIGTGEIRLWLFGEPWVVAASPFFARVIAAFLIAAVAILFTVNTRPARSARRFLRAALWTIALLLFLGPLSFPWYFTWVMALVPFARRRAWLLLPALLPVYYLRFWFLYDPEAAGFPNEEAALEFFDHVIVTAEYAVFFVFVVGEGLMGSRETTDEKSS